MMNTSTEETLLSKKHCDCRTTSIKKSYISYIVIIIIIINIIKQKKFIEY
jgi:hypothetical protein